MRVNLSSQETPAAGSEVRLVLEPGALYHELRRAIFLAAGLYLLYRLAGPIAMILLFFLFVFILAAVLNPLVSRLHSWCVPRMAGALLVVALLIGGIGTLGWLALPPLLNELGNFTGRFDELQIRLAGYYEQLGKRIPQLSGMLPPPEALVQNLTPEWSTIMQRVGIYTLNIATGILSVLVFLMLLIYTLGKPEPLVGGLLAATPAPWRGQVENVVRRCMEQLKRWAFSSIIIGLIVGIVTGLGLHLMGIPYAFLFGAIAAFGELVPNLGPIISSIPPMLMALTIDPMLAVWVGVFFIVLQQVESNLLTPMIMGGHMELHPVSLIFTMVVMHSLYGLLGALLAVPVCAIIKVCWTEFYLKPRQTNPIKMEERAGALVDNTDVKKEIVGDAVDDAEYQSSGGDEGASR